MPSLPACLPWLALGIYLSGNVELNFGAGSSLSGGFWAYTGLLAATVLMLVNGTVLLPVWRWWRQRYVSAGADQ